MLRLWLHCHILSYYIQMDWLKDKTIFVHWRRIVNVPKEFTKRLGISVKRVWTTIILIHIFILFIHFLFGPWVRIRAETICYFIQSFICWMLYSFIRLTHSLLVIHLLIRVFKVFKWKMKNALQSSTWTYTQVKLNESL